MRIWNESVKSKKARLCSEVTLLKTIQALTLYSQNRVRLRRKCHSKAARTRRTSSRRSISLHLNENGGRSQNCTNIRSQNVQTYRQVFDDTNGQTSWSNIEDTVVPLERNLYGGELAGLLWDEQFEGVLLGLGWEKTRGRHENGQKKPEFGSCVEEIDETG